MNLRNLGLVLVLSSVVGFWIYIAGLIAQLAGVNDGFSIKVTKVLVAVVTFYLFQLWYRSVDREAEISEPS